MNIFTLPINTELKNLVENHTYIAEGKVRNVYKIKFENDFYVIKEWKKLKDKNNRNRIIKEIENDTKLCKNFFGNYTKVINEKAINNEQWRKLENNSTGYIRTIQELIIPSKGKSTNKQQMEALLKHISNLMIKVSKGDSIIFPDLNIENFIISDQNINYIDISSYLVSIKNEGKDYRVEDLLHKYIILQKEWTSRNLNLILDSKDIQIFKKYLIENRGSKYCKDLFSEIYEGNLRYWSK